MSSAHAWKPGLQEVKELRARREEDAAALAASRERESELNFAAAQLQDQVSRLQCCLLSVC